MHVLLVLNSTNLCQQTELSFTLHTPEVMQSWSVVGEEMPGHLERADSSRGCAWGQCDANRFSSLHKALEHVHSHIGSTRHPIFVNPHEDPCVVWLTAYHKWSSDRWVSTIRPLIDKLRECAREMRSRVTQIGMFYPGVTDDGSGTRQHSLPKSLVEAFETIIKLYQRTALYLIDCNASVSDSYLFSKIPSTGLDFSHLEATFAEEFKQYTAKLDQYLADAHRHAVVWNSMDNQPEGFGLKQVGLEFLLTGTLEALQCRPLEDGGTRGELMDVFKERTSRLRFLTRAKPSKILFMEINSLETDLDALLHLTKCQARMLEKTREVFDPGSSEETPQYRLETFDREVSIIRDLESRLEARETEISQLQRRASRLRTQVMQAVEVLEEGHVKAIRVFTVVTLFFLPL